MSCYNDNYNYNYDYNYNCIIYHISYSNAHTHIHIYIYVYIYIYTYIDMIHIYIYTCIHIHIYIHIYYIYMLVDSSNIDLRSRDCFMASCGGSRGAPLRDSLWSRVAEPGFMVAPLIGNYSPPGVDIVWIFHDISTDSKKSGQIFEFWNLSTSGWWWVPVDLNGFNLNMSRLIPWSTFAMVSWIHDSSCNMFSVCNFTTSSLDENPFLNQARTHDLQSIHHQLKSRRPGGASCINWSINALSIDYMYSLYAVYIRLYLPQKFINELT